MLGVLVNTIAISVGAIIGVIFRKGLSEKVTSAVLISMGIATFIIGLQAALSLVALFASNLKFLVDNPGMMNEFSAVGNILVMTIGLNLMGVTKVKVANMLPALVIVLILYKLI